MRCVATVVHGCVGCSRGVLNALADSESSLIDDDEDDSAGDDDDNDVDDVSDDNVRVQSWRGCSRARGTLLLYSLTPCEHRCFPVAVSSVCHRALSLTRTRTRWTRCCRPTASTRASRCCSPFTMSTRRRCPTRPVAAPPTCPCCRGRRRLGSHHGYPATRPSRAASATAWCVMGCGRAVGVV